MKRAIKCLFWTGACAASIAIGFVAVSSYTVYIQQVAFTKGAEIGHQFARAEAKAHYIGELKSACVGWWDDSRGAKDDAPILCKRKEWMK